MDLETEMKNFARTTSRFCQNLHRVISKLVQNSRNVRVNDNGAHPSFWIKSTILHKILHDTQIAQQNCLKYQQNNIRYAYINSHDHRRHSLGQRRTRHGTITGFEASLGPLGDLDTYFRPLSSKTASWLFSLLGLCIQEGFSR